MAWSNESGSGRTDKQFATLAGQKFRAAVATSNERRQAVPTILDITNPQHLDQAADKFSKGEYGFVPFGNIIGLFAKPSAESVAGMNEFKGTASDKPVSVSTDPHHLAEIADWSKLSEELDPDKVLSIASDLYRIGPAGIVLPAHENFPSHLSVIDNSSGNNIRTVQVITAGEGSHFNNFMAAALPRIDENYIAATSANESSYSVGAPSPVHYRMGRVLEEFGDKDNFFALTQPRERKMRTDYPDHDQRSTSIIRLYDVARDNNGEPIKEDGKYVLDVTRWGSMSKDATAEIAERHGFGVRFPDKQIDRRYYNRFDRARATGKITDIFRKS